MVQINRYIANQRKHIDSLMEQPLTGFTNKNKELATWDDAAITFTYPNGTTQRFYFTNNAVKPSRTCVYTSSQLLSEELRHLLLAYTIDVVGNNASRGHKGHTALAARQFLCALDNNPAYMTAVSMEAALTKSTKPQYLSSLFKWLHEHKMIPSAIQLPLFKAVERRAGHDNVDHKKNKIPKAKVLLALGAIFHDTIPKDRSLWSTYPTEKQRDAFICTMGALSMSSPNRIAAEQTILDKQRLKTRTEQVKGIEETVHYLDWKGSKGFKDNHKHILGVMSEAIERSLEYMSIVCEPARILARFYEKPTLPLKKVLGEFVPSKANIDALNPDMDEPITLIVVAY